MSLSRLSQSLISVTSTVGLLTISNFVFTDAANAFGVTFSNGGFEDSTNGWTTIGDVTTNTGIDRVAPVGGSNQAVVTNSHQTTGDRIDDGDFSFNQSETNPIDADTILENNDNTVKDLQTGLGLGTNAFSIPREPIVNGNPRTSKEGSAIYQDITVNITDSDIASGKNAVNINFNWAYLTNDGKSPSLGNQDFSFISISDLVSDGTIQVLGDSKQPPANPTADNDFSQQPIITNYDANNTYTQSITELNQGNNTFRVGFGVVDVDNFDRSSALLIDQFNVQQVPFDFSPTAGLAFVATVFGFSRLRRKFKLDNK